MYFEIPTKKFIDISFLPNGIYFVKVIPENKIFKIIKE